MEIRTATTSPTPIPTVASTPGTALPAAGRYAATGDARPAAVIARPAAVMTNAAQQHLPFLPLQGTRPRGAPV